MNKPNNPEFDLPTRPSILSEQTFSSQSHRTTKNPNIDHQERVQTRTLSNPKTNKKPGKKSIFLLAGLFIVVAAGLVAYNLGLDKIRQQSLLSALSLKENKAASTTQTTPENAATTDTDSTATAQTTQGVATEPVTDQDRSAAQLNDAQRQQITATTLNSEANSDAVIEEIIEQPVAVEKPKLVIKRARPQAKNPLLGSLLSPTDAETDGDLLAEEPITSISTENSIRIEMAKTLYIKGYQQEHINKQFALKYWQDALEQAPITSEIYQKIATKIATVQQDLNSTTAQY